VKKLFGLLGSYQEGRSGSQGVDIGMRKTMNRARRGSHRTTRLSKLAAIIVASISPMASVAGGDPSATPSGRFTNDAAVSYLPSGAISQNRSPDDTALSILLDAAKFETQLGGSTQQGIAVSIVAPIRPSHSPGITLDVRGNVSGDGKPSCMVTATHPRGVAQKRIRNTGPLVWTVPVPTEVADTSLALVLALTCGKASANESTIGAIESIDLAWRR
jgi:hypothetical protein